MFLSGSARKDVTSNPDGSVTDSFDTCENVFYCQASDLAENTDLFEITERDVLGWTPCERTNRVLSHLETVV